MNFRQLLTALFFFLTSGLTAQIFIGETEVDTTTVVTGLDIPWEIQWGPDGRIWTTERFGRVSRIHPETGEQDVILDISDEVYQNGESGLLGMVLHPDFENEPYVFMAYTYRPDGQILEKIVRYKYDDGELKNEFILLDNTLLFTMGDAQNQPAAQDLNSLNGKFLRLNLDGSIPDDNPFPGKPVYSFGHRNAQGLFLGPNGLIYSSEHGPNTDDEFNIIRPGQNYGWPNVHGFCNLPDEITFCDANNVVEPLAAWTPTVATSDIVYYNHQAIPEWENYILMTTLKNKRIYALELDENGTSVVTQKQFFTNWWGRLRDILIGPNGEIYLATSGESWANNNPFTHSIIKVWNPEFVSVTQANRLDKSSVRVYPSPATDSFKIEVKTDLIGADFRLLAVEGRIVFSQFLENKLTTIPTIGLQKGIYIVRIENKQGLTFTQKIIIQN